MADRVFVDTNVLIYARDRRDDQKRHRCQHWLTTLGDHHAAHLNLQVLNELTRWLLANDRRPIADLRGEVDKLRLWGEKPIEDREVELAWKIRARHGFQWFDCLLLAAAQATGCRYFLTEDLTHEAAVGPVVIIDPFRASPADVLRQH